MEYLLATFESKNTHATHKSRETGSRSLSKVDKLGALYESIQSGLEPLQLVAKHGLFVEKKQTKTVLTFLQASYVADLAGEEDLFLLSKNARHSLRLIFVM